MHRFALGGYLLQKTKERVLLIISKKKDICKCKGKVVELFTLILGRFSIDFRNLCSKGLLPQFRVGEF